MEKMPVSLPPGAKGQPSSLAIYLPVQSHIHHEMPFNKPHPKGDMLGKKTQLREPDIQTFESNRAKEKIAALIHLGVTFLLIAPSIPGTVCTEDLGIMKFNLPKPKKSQFIVRDRNINN